MNAVAASLSPCNPREPVAERIGPDEWQPVPIAWRDACDRLGKWPGIVASLLERVSGRWWRWSWAGSLTDLWRDLSSRWPWVGRTHFLGAWRALSEAGLVLHEKGIGWVVAVTAAPMQKRTGKARSGASTSPNVHQIRTAPVQERTGVRSGSAPTPSRHKETRGRDVVVGCSDHQKEQLQALDLPPAPAARCTMPQPANDRPIPKVAQPTPGRRNPFAYAYARPEAGEAPTEAQPAPHHAPASEADVGAMRGHPRRPGGLTPADLERLHGLPSTEPAAAPEPPPPSPAPANHVSTEAAFWQSRYPKLCDLAERLWGSRGRANVELRTGVHPELLAWSLRATDSVWGDALAALSRSKAEPGVIGRYLVGVLRRTVPLSEKARRGDVTVPVARPYEAPQPTAPSEPPAPFKRPTLADYIKRKRALAPDPDACNLGGATDEPPPADQGATGDHRHGRDRAGEGLLAEGGRRAG